MKEVKPKRLEAYETDSGAFIVYVNRPSDGFYLTISTRSGSSKIHIAAHENTSELASLIRILVEVFDLREKELEAS